MKRELSQEQIQDIRKNPNKQDWLDISHKYILSEDFITEFQNKVDWYTICAFQKLSKEFIAEFIDKIVFDRLLSNENISKDVKDYCRMFI